MERFLLCVNFDAECGPEDLKGICSSWFDACQKSDQSGDSLLPWKLTGGRRHIQVLSSICGENKGLENNRQWIEVNSRNMTDKLDELCLDPHGSAISKDGEIQTCDLTSVIHSLADLLPAIGYSLDVFMLINIQTFSSFCDDILLYGALKRLVTWHHAHIRYRSDVNDTTVSRLPWFNDLCAVWTSPSELYEYDLPVWRGHLEVIGEDDKQIHFPGFSLHPLKDKQTCSLSISPKRSGRKPREHSGSSSRRHRASKDLHTHHCAVSQKMKVLKQIPRDTIPSFLVTDKQFSFLVVPEGASVETSKSFLGKLVDQPEMSLVVRIEYDTNISPSSAASNTAHTTETWKKKVIEDPQGLSAYEESPVKLTEYSCFMLTSLTSNSGSLECQAFLMRNPCEVNGHVMHNLALQPSYTLPQPCDDISTEVANMLKRLKQFSREDMSLLQQNLNKLQCMILESWISSKQKEDENANVTSTELSAILELVKEKYLGLVNTKWKLPKTKIDSGLSVNLKEFVSEVELNPSDWPERKILSHFDNEKKKLQRFKSAESFAGLSPPPKEENVNLDIDDFLNCFKADGSAVKDNLSPIKLNKKLRKITKVTPRKLCWPAAYDVRFHDIYYNKSISSENNEHHLSRLRARYVSHETSSTCNAVVGKSVPSVKQLTKFKDTGNVKRQRTSPRLRSDRPSSDSQLSASSRLLQKRKGEPLQPPPSKRQSYMRKPVVISVPANETNTDQRSSKDAKACDGRRESRSERHKRQLQDIVDKTLEEKGVGKSHEAYPACSRRLYEHSKQMVKDLPNSYNLKQEMMNIAKDLVDKIVEIQLQRLVVLKRKKSV